MPYKTNKDLPINTSALPEKAKTIWRNAFNLAHSESKDESKAAKRAWGAVKTTYKQNDEGKWVKKGDQIDKSIFKAYCHITEVHETLGIVIGWGMITKVEGEDYYDLDNQHISDELMMKATTEFMKSARVSNDSHSNNDIGTVIHSFPLTKQSEEAMGISSNINGWMVGVKVDEEMLNKFASGEYKGFSIEGSGLLEDEEE